ncbi:MAG: choice-of-anchor J domain-containing protein [Bacteroidota bacterium]
MRNCSILLVLLFSLHFAGMAQSPSRSGRPAPQESKALLRNFPCGGQTVLEENFEGTSIPAGWTTLDLDGLTPKTEIQEFVTAGWQSAIDFKDSTNRALASPSWYEGTTDPSNDWLISPAVSISGNVCLSWYAYSQDQGHPESYEVRYATSPEPDSFLANPALVIISEESFALKFRSLSLEAFSGQTIYLAFRHTTSDGFILFLDDIRVANIENQDIGAVDLKIEATNAGDSVFRVFAAVRNYGSETYTENDSLQVFYSVENEEPNVTVLTDTISLASNDTLQFRYDSLWVNPEDGWYRVCAWTDDAVDNNSLNDTTCILFPVGSAVSVDPAIDNASLSLYPNPFGEEIHYELPEDLPIRGSELSIFNLYGVKVKTLKLLERQGWLTMRDLGAGLYFFRLSHPSGASSLIRVVKH